jgi:ketoreductase
MTGKTVLITGTTSGIGKALTVHLLKQGHKVVMCSRDAERMKELVAQMKSFGEVSNCFRLYRH